MKTVKIDDVHYSMLREIGKRWKMNETDLLKELIQNTYLSKCKRNDA
tara:strand:+ start:224 stop:364 length:141 start_codon:yes stop_codon:yes gene_type:complete